MPYYSSPKNTPYYVHNCHTSQTMHYNLSSGPFPGMPTFHHPLLPPFCKQPFARLCPSNTTDSYAKQSPLIALGGNNLVKERVQKAMAEGDSTQVAGHGLWHTVVVVMVSCVPASQQSLLYVHTRTYTHTLQYR